MREPAAVKLDAETGHIQCGDAWAALTYRQRDVLVALARCEGRPLPRASLIEAGWSHVPETVSDNSIRQMLWNIRKKCREAGIPVEITTARLSGCWSCSPITVEGARPFMMTDTLRRDLQKVLETCPDPALVDRVWSAVGG